MKNNYIKMKIKFTQEYLKFDNNIKKFYLFR